MTVSYIIHQRTPHEQQLKFIQSPAKRKVIRAARRSGKTTGIAYYATEEFLAGRRVLYATPTADQIDRFWYEIKLSLEEPIEAGIFVKNETRHIIELSGTEQRIRAKTAWNADSLRGDYADLLIFDEWQLSNEDAWELVGAPMLLDNDGDAVFIYTPPSLHSRSVTKATDPRHASKLFKQAAKDTTGRWETFHFTSFDNPHISKDALAEIARDMTRLAYRQEILAEDIDEVPGALWTMVTIDQSRVSAAPDLFRLAVAIDPHASSGQAGIITAGVGRIDNDLHGYVLEDATLPAGSSVGDVCLSAVAQYHKYGADVLVAEINNGGDWIENAIRNVEGGQTVNYKTIRATRGKYTRAEPVAAVYEQGRGHMVGIFPELEEELCSWVPGDDSPNRLDAMVWGFTELMIGSVGEPLGELVEAAPGAYRTDRGGKYGIARGTNNQAIGRHNGRGIRDR